MFQISQTIINWRKEVTVSVIMISILITGVNCNVRGKEMSIWYRMEHSAIEIVREEVCVTITVAEERNKRDQGTCTVTAKELVFVTKIFKVASARLTVSKPCLYQIDQTF